jgi:hypothetical protein
MKLKDTKIGILVKVSYGGLDPIGWISGYTYNSEWELVPLVSFPYNKVKAVHPQYLELYQDEDS